jgi:hypothetical protein
MKNYAVRIPTVTIPNEALNAFRLSFMTHMHYRNTYWKLHNAATNMESNIK